MNTHTQIHKEAEASPDLTHTHEHKYHSDQKPVRADRGPACARLGAVPSMPQRPGSPQTWLPGRPRLGALSRPEGFPGWKAPQEAGSAITPTLGRNSHQEKRHSVYTTADKV